MGKPGVRDIALMFVMSAIWGLTFIAIKVAMASLGPLTVSAGRLLLGAALMLVYAHIRGFSPPPTGKAWGLLTVIALLSNALPFTLINWAEQFVDSGVAGILMATSPMFSLLFSHLGTADDRFNIMKLAGVVIGFGGAAIIIGYDAVYQLGTNLVPQIAIAGAAMCYAISGVLIRRVQGMKSDSASALVLSLAATMTLPMSLLVEGPLNARPDQQTIWAMLFLGFCGTGLAQMIRFRLLVSVGATFVSFSGYLIPLFAVVWAWALLGEAVSDLFLFALALILTGTAVSRLARWDLNDIRRLFIRGQSN